MKWANATRRLGFVLLVPALSCGGRTNGPGSDAADGGGVNLGGEGGDDSSGGAGARPAAGGQGNADGGMPSVGGMTAGGGDSASGGSGDGGGVGGSDHKPSGVFPCVGAYYDTDPEPDLYRCVAWTTCEQGTRVTKSGSLTRDRECAECPEGSFTDKLNQSFCEPHRKCDLGLSIANAGTKSSDVVCGPSSGLFPAVAFGSVVAPPRLTATNEALYATWGNSGLVRMTFDGSAVSTRSLSVAQDEVIADLVGVEADLYVVTIGDVTVFDPPNSKVGFLAKHDASGGQVWRRELPETLAYQTSTRVATDGTHLYVARGLQPCRDDVGYCYPEGDSEVALSSYDTDGNLLWEKTEPAQRDFASVTDIAVAGNVLHVGVERFYGVALRRYDLAGTFIDETFSLGEEDFWIRSLSPNPEGGVTLFGYPSTLFELTGSEAVSVDLGGGLAGLNPLTVSQDKVYLAGWESYHDDVLLLETSRTGQQLATWQLGGPQSDEATAVVQAPSDAVHGGTVYSGSVYFSGVTTSQLGAFLFIQPWPQ